MAQQPDNQRAGPPAAPALDEPRLRRYLPAALVDDLLRSYDDPDASPDRLVEAFVHLACARATIATYLPRMLSGQLLERRSPGPWLRWVEGSLLFADLSGSTALAERLSTLGREGTELVTAFLNQIFTTLIQVIQEYGGDLVAFGGDALLVFFGDDRHPRTAARAALALQEAMRGYVQVVPGVGSFPMHLHIGVESGRVAFVSAGGERERHYGVLGATVNRVAAAEGYARPNEVVAGPGAWATLAGFAQGQQVAPGFYRVGAIRAPARPHPPLPEEPAITAAPQLAIPRLLDELDRVSPYIPADLLRRILAEPQLPQIEADLRPVSALFAQVVGLEALAEALPDDQAAQAIHSYVAAMQAAVQQFGGVVNKLDVADEGIRLVAIFGAPAAYEDHAERAARAALAMEKRLGEVNDEIAILLEDQGPKANDQRNTALQGSTDSVEQLWSFVLRPSSFVLRQRIGLNPGTVFAGNVGSAARKEYTVMGDAVNVAARVMGAAGWGEIWCSEATAQAIAGRMICEDRGHLALKGKALPLQLFCLAGERDRPAGALARGDGPLIGRAAELAWLRQQLDAALAGAGRAIRIVGDAGIGKSRLSADLLAEAARRGVRIIAASCFSYTASIPYAAWGEWLKSLCGIVSGDDDALRARKIAARLAELGPEMTEWLPLVGDLARLDVPENRLTRGLDPQMRQARRFELLEQLLLRAAADGPVLALFEDLHWADPISLELWRRVAGKIAGHPIVILGIHRPTAALDPAGDGAQLLDLKELSREQSGNLVAALAGSVALPEQLVQKLVERSAGNPLFLAELLRAVQPTLQIEQREQSGIHHLQSAIEELPDSLNGLLLARIDRLEEHSRGVLRVASVVGQRVPFGVLHAIQSADQRALLRELTRLDAENITQLERLEPERVHTFRHALIQEVAYQSMLYARRRDLHGRIGEYLERRYADDLDDYYGLLAHHYGLSDRPDKAVEYLLRAGHAARAVYANDEAIQDYTRALEILAGDAADPRGWEARDALGDVYATIGRFDEALAQHSAILDAPGVTAEVACRAHGRRGNVLEKQGQFAAALEELDRAMAIAGSDAGGARLAVAQIDADIALVHKRRGEYDLAIAACEEGLQALHGSPGSLEAEQIEARLSSELGGIYGWRGDYRRAREQFERGLQLRAAIDDLPGMTGSHNNLGYLWQMQGEYERAIEHYGIAEDLAKKINLRHMIVFAAGNAALALINLSAYAEARARCMEALEIARELNAQHNIAQSYDLLGLIAYHQGDYPRALEEYARALQLNRALGSAYPEGSTLLHIALALNAQGRHAEAAATAGQVRERAESLRGPELQVESLNALAEAALGLGRLAEASAHAQEAATLGHAIGSKRELGIARRLLGQVAAARGEPYAADFEESLALLGAIKDRFEIGRAWAAYAAALLASGDEIAGRAYLKQAQDTFMSIGATGELERLTSAAERSG